MLSRTTLRMSSRTRRTYEDAVKLLEARRRPTRPKDAANPLSDPRPHAIANANLKGKPGIDGMRIWLNQLGHTDVDLDALNIVHVAGTKGKGSTCAFVSAFLVAHGMRTGYPRKVGLYTSPHLKYMHERIRIDSKPIAKQLFAKYVFEVSDTLDQTGRHKPRFLQLLALTAIHTFIKEKVDIAICETHSGGKYDATNVLPHPAVAGITTIGMDHVQQLGPTLENIARHKAGIVKPGSPAFSVPQQPIVKAVLEKTAVEEGVDLRFVDEMVDLPHDVTSLRPLVQRSNASLAIALTNTVLRQRKEESLSKADIQNGAGSFSWPGRFQKLIRGQDEWYLDGAHNDISVQIAAEWFSDIVTLEMGKRHVLIFSNISERDGPALLGQIAKVLKSRRIRLDAVILSTYKDTSDAQSSTGDEEALDEKALKRYITTWQAILPDVPITFRDTIEGAISLAQQSEEAGGTRTLITGSLYLVGGALRILEPEDSDIRSTDLDR